LDKTCFYPVTLAIEYKKILLLIEKSTTKVMENNWEIMPLMRINGSLILQIK